MKYSEAKLLERGSLIRLNSGGPDMTVVSSRINEVEDSDNEEKDCTATLEARWFNDDKLESAEFAHWEVFSTGTFSGT